MSPIRRTRDGMACSKQLLPLALLLGYYTQGAAGVCSVSTCTELGWGRHDNIDNAYVDLWPDSDQTICGESDSSFFPFHPVTGRCSGLVNYTVAYERCNRVGSRLCTASELLNDEARGTGCNYDYELVWSSSTDGCSAGEYVTAYGGSNGGNTTQCATASDVRVAYARCCADAYHCTDPPTQLPSALPTLPPTPLPTVAPSIEPTALPTHLPTPSPSPVPTPTPTPKPTPQPTVTHSPTTWEPSATPTHLPSEIPTHLPTSTPTEAPTTVPVPVPTSNPSQAPLVRSHLLFSLWPS
jgi:hypothetical protein